MVEPAKISRTILVDFVEVILECHVNISDKRSTCIGLNMATIALN